MAGIGCSLFVLVKWVNEEDMWDVLPIKNAVGVITEIDLRDATGCGHGRNSQRVFEFYWRRGREAAPCTILAYGRQKEMEKKLEMERTKNDGGTSESSISVREEELGVGRRKTRKPARLESDPDFEEFEQPAKKKQKAPVATHAILDELQRRQVRNQEEELAHKPDCRCAKYDSLRAKYKELKAERTRLSAEVAELSKFKELHTVVDQLKVLCSNATYTLASEKNDGDTSFSDSTPVKKPSSKSKVDIGYGVLMDKGQLLTVVQGSDTATKLARNLFSALFSRDEVMGKSLTGKKSNAHQDKGPKEALDPARVKALLDYTLKRFPSASGVLLRQSLANKVKELSKPRD
ncbi:uncharacterized protein LOC110990826 [Acanthaster planci]|uniref:Uncharacterized protein LOC110990826 n=1 Tax=Acanthaster planci TaxID=133434 RepID=A0A8B8A1I8_ACAPL|nr:uncharacterized protein LOC110990826 [Acanthaster planci]